MKSNNNYLFNISLIFISIVLIIYLLYLNDRKIGSIEKFKNGFDILNKTQNKANRQLCSGNLFYIQCVIYNKEIDPITNKNKESAKYRLYYDIKKQILRFGRISENDDGYLVYRDSENNSDTSSNQYFLNDPTLKSKKNFLFRMDFKDSNYTLKTSEGQDVKIKLIDSQKEIIDLKLLKQKKFGANIVNYKIILDDNNPLIISLLDDRKQFNFSYENDLNCTLYDRNYKKKLSNMLNSDYKSFEKLELVYPNYKTERIKNYLKIKKDNLEISNKKNYCPLTHPYPYDTIIDEIDINDDDDIDFTINYNNKCCSLPPVKKLRGIGLKDKVSGEVLDNVEIEKIENYIEENKISILNDCRGGKKMIDENKRFSFLNMKDNQKVRLDDDTPQQIKNLNSIITNKDLYSITNPPENLPEDLPFEINQRSLFELVCVYGSGGTKIRSLPDFIFPNLVSSDSSGLIS